MHSENGVSEKRHAPNPVSESMIYLIIWGILITFATRTNIVRDIFLTILLTIHDTKFKLSAKAFG